MLFNQENIQTLWEKYLSRSATPDEVRELFAALNEEELEELHHLASAAIIERETCNEVDDPVLRTALWEQIQAQTIAPVHPISKRSVLLRPHWKWAAAILIVAGTLVYKFGKKTDPVSSQELAAVDSSVAPAPTPYHQPTLTLSNGQVIVLDSFSHQIRDTEGNVTITRNAQGALAYIQNRENTGITQELRMNTLSTPVGGLYQIVLPDGTRVWLNSMTVLQYPTQFPGATREVSLTGEAYFEVARNSKQPFIVKTKNSQTLVTGTHFNICAYPDEPAVATLVEGGVLFGANTENASLQKLSPSRQAILGNEGIPHVRTVETDNYTCWMRGEMIFENEPLYALMQRLSRWYDIDVQYQSPSLKTLRFTGKAHKNKPVAYILDLIEKTTDVRFVISGKTVQVQH